MSFSEPQRRIKLQHFQENHRIGDHHFKHNKTDPGR